MTRPKKRYGIPVNPSPPEELGEIDIYGPAARMGYDAEDWLRGAVEWPWPDVDNSDDLRAKLMDHGDDISQFKNTLLYKRWVGRKPWLKDV